MHSSNLLRGEMIRAGVVGIAHVVVVKCVGVYVQATHVFLRDDRVTTCAMFHGGVGVRT